MAEEPKVASINTPIQSRRVFVKTAAQVAMTAPAAVLLLDASSKPAKAAEPYTGDTTEHLDDASLGDDSADDATFGDFSP